MRVELGNGQLAKHISNLTCGNQVSSYHLSISYSRDMRLVIDIVKGKPVSF